MAIEILADWTMRNIETKEEMLKKKINETTQITKKNKLLQSLEIERQIKSAVTLQRINSDFAKTIKHLRSKEYKTTRHAISYLKEKYPDYAITSHTNIAKWIKDYSFLISNNIFFSEFLEKAGLSQENKKDNDKNTRNTIKEKQEKLKEETKQAKLIIAKLNDPNMADTEVKEILEYNARRQLDKINKAMVDVPFTDWIEELYNINWKILAIWKKKILDVIQTLDPTNFQELKALSDILDTTFKQNRLIEGKSTDNIAVWVKDIYDQIIENAQKKKLE